MTREQSILQAAAVLLGRNALGATDEAFCGEARLAVRRALFLEESVKEHTAPRSEMSEELDLLRAGGVL